MCIYTVPGWASQLVFSDFLHFDTRLFIIDCYPAGGYLISIAYCLFFICSNASKLPGIQRFLSRRSSMIWACTVSLTDNVFIMDHKGTCTICGLEMYIA